MRWKLSRTVLRGGTGGNTGSLLDRQERGKKIPMLFYPAPGGVMGFAGLWERWPREDGSILLTCCIITTPPNALVAPFHDRMPAILFPADYALWLDHEAELKAVHNLLRPCPAELLAVSEANPLVNSPKNEGAQLLDPAA